jgi:uncharacterized protein (TIGR03086 family)
MEGVELLQQVVAETTRLVDGTSEADLAKPTPCTEWTVRDLINHVTGGSTMFAVSAEQGSVPDELMGQLMGGDNLGDDYKGAFKTATTRALAAFDGPGALEKIVKLPFGEMPAGIALNVAIVDVATHAADLAVATGQSMANDEMIEAALAIGRQMDSPMMRSPGVFGPAQPCADSAPAMERLLAFAGRAV